MKELIIYNPPDKTISQLVDAYIDYVSNPLNEWRQPSEYLDAEIAGKPIPLQEMALTYKSNLSSTYKCNFLGADNKQ